MNEPMRDAHDMKDLLGGALSGSPALDHLRPGPVDPTADLLRGRALLRRRRMRVATGLASGALALAVAVPFAVDGLRVDGAPVALPAAASSTAPAPTARSAGAGVESAAGTTSLGAVELVAYTGQQPPGYRVGEVPAGWEIQGGDAYVLTIAEKGAADRDKNSFVGKLVVMLQSKDASVPGEGDPVTVNGLPGRYRVTTAEDVRRWQPSGAPPPAQEPEDTQSLVFQDAAKHWIVIQCPARLGWDAARLIRFAEGVTVLRHAQAGVG